ncbi:allantoate permease [Arthroderma uncinatum]|uniref:allantoate permease n=1 Tax=Arthroderma uncinatum TaxID=74035 RepID=UPI00144A76EB|nr:allantoate permease [Arthroderma uncinatum]KAF3479891.1 allantoate permease [Arthroderma uncinatum]
MASEASEKSPIDQKMAMDKEAPTSTGTPRDLDQAYQFLQTYGETSDGEEATAEDLKKIRWKVDLYIIPIMFVCYTMQFIDKVSLNYAAVMGLNKDLKLKGNNFSNAATAFFIAYLIAEIPTGYILNKVSAPKWLALNVTLWGISTACTAAARDYNTLLAARIFLGIFEAAIAPCLVLISSQWYTKSEQAPRFCIWYSGLGLGQIIGGLVSFGFQHVKNPEFTGWKAMFVVLGAVTCLAGIATYFIIPDSPMKAPFLTEKEKAQLLKHVSFNQTGVINTSFKFSHILEILTDVQLWLMTLITVLISVSSGVVTTYSATLIRNFGYSPTRSALLNMPGGAVSIISTIVIGFAIRYKMFRFIGIIACCIPGILGGALLSFAPQTNQGALLAGIYLVNSIVPTLIVIYQWLSSNVAGSTKRAVSASLVTASFSIGNIIGPQTFQAKDAPQYIPAKIAVLATQASGAVIAFVLFLYYVWENKRRDKRAAQNSETLPVAEGAALSQSPSIEQKKWDNLTDKENLAFRYVY